MTKIVSTQEPTVLKKEPYQPCIRPLYDMLSTMRPEGSAEERKFVGRYLLPLGCMVDAHGNVFKRIGDAPISWSCHTDTVHHIGGRQHIIQDAKTYVVGLRKTSLSNCLGADDTAGVWIMTEMIKAERPGLYIFHRGEEKGCVGSRWIVKNNPELVKGIEAMIALDRRGVNSVITRQVGGRCCSDEFGRSLAAQLGDLEYKLDPTGTVTDSAQYTDLIGECTNLSVGYYSQHCSGETLDVIHILRLLNRLLEFDHTKLEFKRKPGEKEKYSYTYYHSGRYRGGVHRDWDDEGLPYGGYGHNSRYDDDDHPDPWGIRGPHYYPSEYRGGYWLQDKFISCTKNEWEKRGNVVALLRNQYNARVKMTEYIRDNAVDVAMMLEEWGFDLAGLRQFVETTKESKDGEKSDQPSTTRSVAKGEEKGNSA